jgi:hypothetical protein
LNKRQEATVSVRIRESDYDALIEIMSRHGLRTVKDAVTHCVQKNTGTTHVAGPCARGKDGS